MLVSNLSYEGAQLLTFLQGELGWFLRIARNLPLSSPEACPHSSKVDHSTGRGLG